MLELRNADVINRSILCEVNLQMGSHRIATCSLVIYDLALVLGFNLGSWCERVFTVVFILSLKTRAIIMQFWFAVKHKGSACSVLF